MVKAPTTVGRTIRIGVVMTSHNRRKSTLASIAAVYRQALPDGATVDLHLVDDGSLDDTAVAVMTMFPKVHLIKEDGTRYWNGGMRIAFCDARRHEYDYYLWLNDDTIIEPIALRRLLGVHQALTDCGHDASIVVGSTQDSRTGELSYGGWRSTRRGGGTGFAKVTPSNEAVQCDTLNGNCALFPKRVVERVGDLDDAFTHGMGDMDYGLRARKEGCTIWIAPGYFGTCDLNSGKGLWTDETLSLWERWRRLMGPKGLPPREWFVFTRRHSGPLWPVYWANPYVKFWLRACLRKSTAP